MPVYMHTRSHYRWLWATMCATSLHILSWSNVCHMDFWIIDRNDGSLWLKDCPGVECPRMDSWERSQVLEEGLKSIGVCVWMVIRDHGGSCFLWSLFISFSKVFFWSVPHKASGKKNLQPAKVLTIGLTGFLELVVYRANSYCLESSLNASRAVASPMCPPFPSFGHMVSCSKAGLSSELPSSLSAGVTGFCPMVGISF